MNLYLSGHASALKDGHTPEEVLAWCEREIARSAVKQSWMQGVDGCWFKARDELIRDEERREHTARRAKATA